MWGTQREAGQGYSGRIRVQATVVHGGVFVGRHEYMGATGGLCAPAVPLTGLQLQLTRMRLPDFSCTAVGVTHAAVSMLFPSMTLPACTTFTRAAALLLRCEGPKSPRAGQLWEQYHTQHVACRGCTTSTPSQVGICVPAFVCVKPYVCPLSR